MYGDSVDVLTHFGESLRSLRKARGLSQEQLALMCNLDRTYISGLERGKRNPTLRVIAIVATQLGLSLRELFDEVEVETR